jgi:hypothetical protein
MATTNRPLPEEQSEGAAGETELRPALAAPNPGSRKLGIILAIVLIGFFLSLFFHYNIGAVHGLGYPLGTFLFRPGDQFNDFYNNYFFGRSNFGVPPAQRVITPGWGSTVLMLRAYLLYALFFPEGEPPPQYMAGTYPALVLPWLGSQFIFLAGAVYFFRRMLSQITQDCLWGKMLALTLCSYPFLFSLDRSNFESTIFVLLFADILLYRQGRFLWASLLLGAIIALKPYGVVFLAIPFADRRLRDVAAALGVAVLMTLAGLVLLPGGAAANFVLLQKSMTTYNMYYVQANEGLYFGSSLYGMVKVWIYATHAFVGGMTDLQVFHFFKNVMAKYFVFAAGFYLLVVLLICGFRMAFWKKIALLVCCMNLLPFICGDYRLIHLFIPLLLFLTEAERTGYDGIFSVLFGLLLIPTGYVHFVFDPVFHVNPYEISDTVVLHPMLMLTLVFAIAFSVLRKPVRSDMAQWISQLLRRRRGEAI